jgi:hypothetical protein
VPSSHRSRGRVAGLTLLVASAVLVLAACGGGGSDDGNDDSSADGNGQNTFAAYADCMSRNGVQLNTPSAFPSGRAVPRRSDEPGTRPSGFPTNRPSGFPTSRPSGASGDGMRGGFGRPAGVDDDAWQQAQEACRSVLPSSGPGGQGGPGGGGERNGAFTAYRNCLSDHGVTVNRGVEDLNTTDPKTAASLKACEALRPTSTPTVAPSPAS